MSICSEFLMRNTTIGRSPEIRWRHNALASNLFSRKNSGSGRNDESGNRT